MSDDKKKYKVEFAEDCKTLALLGYDDERLASHYNVEADVFSQWVEENESLRSALAEGRELASGQVARSLFDQATGKVKVRKQKLARDGSVVLLEEDVPPSYKAAELYLKTRHSESWDKPQQHEHTVESHSVVSLILDDIAKGSAGSSPLPCDALTDEDEE